jgi:hypothetical protein
MAEIVIKHLYDFFSLREGNGKEEAGWTLHIIGCNK